MSYLFVLEMSRVAKLKLACGGDGDGDRVGGASGSDDASVVVIAPSDHLKEKTLSAIHECKARGAKIILIHEKGDAIAEEGDISIPVPKIHPWLTPLLTVLPLQLMAYRTAVRLGKDVDRPRNLAKSVTVE